MADAEVRDLKAPHGRDDDGQPLTPYGTKVDGTPRLSRRGATAGARGNAPKKAAPRRSATDSQRRKMLVELTGNFIEMPLIALSSAPPVVSRLGQRHADALALDAYVIGQAAEPLAEALVVLSQSKPGVLSWLDTAEEKAPYLQLMMVGISIAKAFVSNHTAPNASEMAAQVRQAAQVKAQGMMEDIERQAETAGV